MSVTRRPERDGRVYIWTYSDAFTTAEVATAIDEFQREVLDKATKKIHTISDFTAVKRVPSNILSTGVRMMRKPHPMSGVVIQVTSNTFLKTLVDVFIKLVPSGTVLVRGTVADALVEIDRLLALEAQGSPQNDQSNPSVRG